MGASAPPGLRPRWLPLSQACGRAGRFECDHVVALERGGSSDMSNLQALCRSCHIAKTRGENNRRTKSPEQLAWQKLVAELT